MRRIGTLLVAALAALLLLPAAGSGALSARAAGTSPSTQSAITPRVTPPPFKDAIPSNGLATDHGWFQGGYQWVGDFGDPTVVRSGDTYYAYSTPGAGRYLPIMTSKDLIHWYARPGYSTAGPPGVPGYNVNTDAAIPAEIRATSGSDVDKYNQNDGLVAPASWGINDSTTGPFINRDLWAPGVIQIGNTWFAYSAVRVSWVSDDPYGFGRFCLTVATSTSPLGPFRDASGGAPIQCQSVATDPAGSIDPFPFHDPTNGKYYLLWKAAGKRVPGGAESSLRAVEIGLDGKPVPGAPWVKLLETNRADPWEGSTVENPGMVNIGGRTYIFYSANLTLADGNGASNYATGYAYCPSGPRAACARLQHTPLLASSGYNQGPGGSSPFIGFDGSLRVAYATFWLGENRNPRPRRLHIARIWITPNGTLTFTGDDTGAAPTNASLDYVRAGYTDFLNRAPGADELAPAAAGVDDGTVTPSSFIGAMANSAEWVSAFVQQAYVSTLGRPGDAGGVNYWAGQIRLGLLTPAQVAGHFYASDEYFQGIGGGTNTSWLTDLYHKLLKRNPDAGGLNYWLSQVAASGRVAVATRFYDSSESCHTRVADLFEKLLGRAPDTAGADYWAGRLPHDGDIALAANLAASREYRDRAITRFG